LLLLYFVHFSQITLKCIGGQQNEFYATQQAQQTEYCAKLETRNLEAPALERHTSLDWGCGQIDGRSTSDVLLLLYGNPVAKSTEKQTNVVISTGEAEHIVITSGFKEAKYLINLMQVK
jgi:hypothetical protein